MRTRQPPPGPVPAAFALPIAASALLVVGVVVEAANGRIDGLGLLALCASVVALTALFSDTPATLTIAVIAWLTAVAFSGRPYAELHLHGSFPRTTAVVLASTALVSAVMAGARRWATSRGAERVAADVVAAAEALTATAAGRRSTLADVTDSGNVTPARGLLTAVGRRRRAAGLALAIVLLPATTLVLASVRPHLSLADDLLIYLVLLVAITVVGGFWPAVLAAVASSLLLNWYFTPPLHTWGIEQPQNLLALLLFVVVALSVSALVHLSARRATDAARASREARSLLDLARTVLSGNDSPSAILGHLHEQLGVSAELQEHTGERWTTVATSPGRLTDEPAGVLPIRSDLRLVLHGQPPPAPRLLAGFAAQAGAALDRERLRIQAAQSEALAEGNRIRTALLAAVSHDLRTPLASVKAAVSSLRQSDVTWSAEDEAALLATIEESTDRLDALIANLLDMSRIHAGSLQPFLRPTAVDEIVPVALRGLDGGERVTLALPETLPLVAADPGLLERAVANLVANALRYSPPHRPPAVEATCFGDEVRIAVVDHGPGVPVDARKRIFEPFQRLGDRSGGGVGLGLAVARGFIAAMGGTVAPEETPGGGLTMRITLRPAGQRHDAGVLS